MLNKPKFMSPSVNMYGNTVIDLNSSTLPFSCVVDGNEAVMYWQIKVSNLNDNKIVFDTGKKKRSSLFYPINNRNQNVVFSVNLKEHFATAEICYIKAETTYDKDKTYYKYSNQKYEAYEHNGSESTPSSWSSECESLYYTNFVNSNEPYYWSITLWSKANVATYSSEEVFYANSIPKATIYYSYDNNFYNGDILNSDLILSESKDMVSALKKRKVFFKADYEQSENITIKRYGWRLTDTNKNIIFIDTITENQIYGIEDDISCECNGLVNDSSYLLELYIETQNGYSGIIKSIVFNVVYDVKNIDVDFDIKPLNNSSGIMLNWGTLRTTEGVVVGRAVTYEENYPISNSTSVKIPDGSKIVFEGTANGKPLGISEDSYIILSFQIEKDINQTILDVSGADNTSNLITRSLFYDHADNALKYTVTKGDIAVSDSVVLEGTKNKSGQICWYIATLYPLSSDSGLSTRLKVSEILAENSTIPSDELYPNTTEYPYVGGWKTIKKG